jgi:hypothetical protein
VFWSHRTGNSRKGLIAHSGAKLAAGDVTSDRDDENETGMKGNGSETKEIW